MCQLARLLRACGQLQMQIKLPAFLSLGVAGRDTSWRALLVHMRQKAAAPEASEELVTVTPLLLPGSGQPYCAASDAGGTKCRYSSS